MWQRWKIKQIVLSKLMMMGTDHTTKQGTTVLTVNSKLAVHSGE